ncbi:MAG: TonB-dependent receptor [Parvularculaceae bacterium]
MRRLPETDARKNSAVRSRPVIAPALATSLALGLGFVRPALAADANDDAAPKDEIIVDGQKRETETLGRVLTPILETPQAVSAISREELEERGLNNLNDALRSVPGLSLGAGETSFQGNNAILRGFTTRNDSFLDNIRDFGYYYRDTFNDESIEVYKGPSSILFGRGSTGGVIHRISKKPIDATAIEAELTGGLDETRRATIDANFAGVAGVGSALRINAMAHRSEVEDRDFGRARRWGVAPSLALGLGQPTRLNVSYFHQEEKNRPDYGVPWIAGDPSAPGFPAPVPRNNYYGFENDYLNTNVDIATLKIEHDLNAAVTLRSQTRYSNNTRQFRYSEAVIPAGTPQGAPLDTITVTRNLFEGYSTDTFLQSQNDIVARFSQGRVRHSIIAGVEAGREGSKPVYVTNFNVPSTSLVAPTHPFYDSAANQFVRLRADARATTLGLYAIDAIEFGERWRLIGGLRWDRFASRYDSTGFNADGSVNATTAIDRIDKKLTWRAALVFKPLEDLSLYGAYGTSFNPSGEGIESFISAGRSVAQANINLDPETGKSAEIGAKLSLWGDRALLSASLFRLTKNNVRVPDGANPGFNTLGGEQRVDGAEISFDGQVTPRWRLHWGYAFLDSKTAASNSSGGPLVGAPLIITPRHSGSFSTSYDLTSAISAGAALIGVSERLGQNSATSYLAAPGFVLSILMHNGPVGTFPAALQHQ